VAMIRSEGESVLESHDELSSGLERLSNHFQKYRQLVEQNIPELRQRLAEKGMAGKVHLWRKSHNYKRQMMAVARVAESTDEMQRYIGTYFALQMLHLHFISIESLRREFNTDADRGRIYRHILCRLRIQRRTLISTYLGMLIHVFAENTRLDGIAICNVGMIMDQEDLDVAVFISPGVNKQKWNAIIGQVAAEFFKYSSKMHFYLAELVTTRSYLTTANDFQRFLETDVSNYILISELMASEYLIGDTRTMQSIEEKIINKFYFDKNDRYFHEAYLRGLMAEVQGRIQQSVDSRWTSPKNDALRLIHNSVSLLKSIYGIHEHGSRDTLDTLIVRDPESKNLYLKLQNTLNFCEMFLHVYQLLISIDDQFDPSDPVTLENLDIVAEVMRFEHLGPVRPGSRLLVHYYEQLALLSELAERVVDKVNRHLKQNTVFKDLLHGNQPLDLNIKWTDSLIRNLFFAIKQFRGIRYWDDILQLMAENNGRHLNQLVESIEQLSAHHRLHIFRRLIEMIAYDMDSMIMMAVLFREHIRLQSDIDYAHEMNVWLLELLKNDLARVTALVKLVLAYPETVTRFLVQLDQQQISDLEKAVYKITSQDEDFDKLQKKFAILCRVLIFSSNNYRRFFVRVVGKRPEIVTHIDDMKYLDRIRQLLWAELSDAESPKELKERLIVYYQFGFCRCGLEALNRAGDLESFYRMYHSFFRRYFRWLYRAAQWTVETERNYSVEFRTQDEDDQPMAIFCTGGYAREEAFENDIDLFVICENSDQEFVRYASSIINDMNRELNRQGVLTHHRFAEIFNSFVIPVEQLASKIEKPDETDFIEWSQLLGARLLVGSQSLDRILANLLEEKLFSNPSRFVKCLLAEIEDRRNDYKKQKTRPVNVKENPGGLRDIQMILQAAQAYIGNRESDVWKTFETLMAAIPELATEFKTLERVYKFLRTFKDIYYLSLSAEDEMIRDRLIYVSQQMGIESADSMNSNGSAPRLINSYRGHRYRARQAILVIGKYLMDKVQ
jgi:predicted nucleotidyltransferase